MAERGDDLAERARKLFAGPIAFLKSAPELQFLPEPDVPEIAFAGRSNVGKSSLLNALTNRKSLARTSNTPGRTQELNFFDVGGRIRHLAGRVADVHRYLADLEGGLQGEIREGLHVGAQGNHEVVHGIPNAIRCLEECLLYA